MLSCQIIFVVLQDCYWSLLMTLQCYVFFAEDRVIDYFREFSQSVSDDWYIWTGEFQPVEDWEWVYVHCLLCAQPIALVSWGRTLELSTVASSDVCDWLETTTSARNTFGGVSQSRKYDLLLTWSAEQHRQQHAHPEEHSAKMKVRRPDWWLCWFCLFTWCQL